MKRGLRALTITSALLLMSSQAALAWDPFGGEALDPGPVTPPDPAPLVIPDGVYLVTDVYTGDVVTTAGDTTTYSTTTTHEMPGTYARVVDVVGSGAGSAFDGSSFNERGRLPDGRSVAGTYYEDFVLTPSGLVSVNLVFFQDDSATRTSASAPRQPSAPTALPAALPPSGRPISAEPVAQSPEPRDTPAPAPNPLPEPRTAGAAVALAPLGPSLSSIEVLRGRSVRLWLRAFAAGVPVPVRSWRLVAGAADMVSRREGGGGDPCDALWLTLAPAGTVWTLRFEVTSDFAPGRALIATLGVAVRSPALGQ